MIKTTTMMLFAALCCMAQNVDGGPSPYSTLHGVTITGTTAPTITNSPTNPPILGLVYQTLGSGGLNPLTHLVEYDRILSGTLVAPGESVTYQMANVLTPRGRRMDSAGNVTMVSVGTPVGYKMLAVVFSTGAFYTQARARDVGMWKADKNGKPVLDAAGNGMLADDSVVQDMLLARLTADINSIRSAISSSVPPDLAAALARLKDTDARVAGLARLAALPTVVKGE